MRPECQDAAEEALGRPLRRSEIKQVEDAIHRNMRELASKDREAWQAMSVQERYDQGAKAAVAEMLDKRADKERRARLQVLANDRIANQLEHAISLLPPNAKKGSMQKILQGFVAFDSTGIAHGVMSAETRAQAIGREVLGNMVAGWEHSKGFLNLFQDKNAAANMEREMWGEDSGDPAAKSAVDIWKQWCDELWDRANKAGTYIGKREDWHRPQTYSQARIANGGGGKDTGKALEHWNTFVIQHLDRSRYTNEDGTPMSDEDVTHKVLTEAFDTQMTDARNKTQGNFNPDGTPRMNTSDAAGNMSGHRILHYKNADSFMAVQAEFGDTNIWRGMVNHVDRMAREIALRETFGPEWALSFDHFNRRVALDEIRSHGDNRKVTEGENFGQALLDYVSANHRVVDQRVADAGQAFRLWETMTKLGSVVLTAFGDEAGMAATCYANGVPWTSAARNQLTYLNPANARDRAIIHHAGMAMNTMIGDISRIGTENPNSAPGAGFFGKSREFGAKYTAAVLKYSGAEPMWDARRAGLGALLSSYMARTVQKYEHFSDINETDHGILARKGFTEADWQVMRLAVPEDWSRGKMLTANSIRAIPDAQLKALGDPQTLRRNASSALLGHVLEESGMGVMDQGARQRASVATLGTQGGTGAAVMGELMRSAMLFKGFSMSMAGKHWTRAASFRGGSGPNMAGYNSRIVVVGTIMGAFALQLAALMRGEDPENIAEPKFWLRAALKGGGAGFYGDFLSELTNSRDADPIAAAMGTPGTQAKAIYDLTYGAAVKKAKGEKTDEAANALRFMRDNNPTANWYTKWAWDHYVWNDLQEAASPGYLDRMKGRAEARNDTSWYFDPHDKTPERAPDIGKAWDPEKGKDQLDAAGHVVKSVLGVDE